MASMSDVKLPFETVRDQINSAVDVMVHLGRGVDGSRRIVEVAAVASNRREQFRLQTVMKFAAEPIGAGPGRPR